MARRLDRNVYTLSTIIVLFTLSGCSLLTSPLVHLLGLDSESEYIGVRFDFKSFRDNQLAYVSRIKIYSNDTLVYNLESFAQGTSTWQFPELPHGFKITYPEGADIIRAFKKTEKIRFEFGSQILPWTYEPKFSSADYQWLFDSVGRKKIDINCYYEPWIGKDVIRIASNKKFTILKESFQLTDEWGKPVAFELKYRNDFTDEAGLVLKKDLKKGDKLLLVFKAHDGKIYKELIPFTDNTTIGIAGKLSGL